MKKKAITPVFNFDEIAERYYSIETQLKQLDKEKKQIKPQLATFIKEKGGTFSGELFVGTVSERTRKQIRDDAASVLKQLIGEEEAQKYIVTVETLPKEVAEQLLNAGKITPAQFEMLFKVSSYDVISVKPLRNEKATD